MQRESEIHVVDAHGAEPPLTEQGSNLRGKGEFPIARSIYDMILAPGEVQNADEDISQIYSLTAPGDYKASVCRVVVELGPVLSNVVSFTVTPQ